MFRKLRDTLCVASMIVLSLLVLAVSVLSFVVVEQKTQAANKQLLAHESFNQSRSFSDITQLLNSEDWDLVSAEPESSVSDQEGKSALAQEAFGDGRIMFHFKNKAWSIQTDGYALSYHVYPSAVYREARNLLPGSHDYEPFSFTYDGRSWLCVRIIETFEETLAIRDTSGDEAREGHLLPESITTLSNEVREQLYSPRLALVDVTDSLLSLSDLRWILIASSIILILFSFFVSLYFANHVIRPAQNSLFRQQRILSDASRELKDSSSVIKASQETSRNNPAEATGAQREWPGFIEGDSTLTNRLGDKLSLLSKEGTSHQLEAVDLSTLVGEKYAEFEACFNKKGLYLHENIPLDVQVFAEADTLDSALNVLFRCALDYTPEGNDVFVDLTAFHRESLLVFRSTGIVFSEEELKLFFDPYSHIEKALDSHPDGFGLDLSLAQNALLSAGGKVEVQSDDDSVTFAVRFKLK